MCFLPAWSNAHGLGLSSTSAYAPSRRLRCASRFSWSWTHGLICHLLVVMLFFNPLPHLPTPFFSCLPPFYSEPLNPPSPVLY